MTLYKWSQTAALDATVDASINWQEGQAPSSINDSARAMMAATAKWRDDMGPSIQTAGTSTAYTLATNQVFDTFANMANKEISFFCHTTNGDSPTLNVDGLGAKAIVTAANGAAVPNAAMTSSSIHTVTYSNSAGQFVLKGFYNPPYVVPLGGIIDYAGSSVPNSSFAFPNGQAISRSTFAALFALIGTTYGVGDGSTTFNIPDLTGRVVAMKEASATRLTSTYFGGNSTTLGAVGGLESQTLIVAQIPASIPVSVSGSISVTSTVSNILASNGPPDNWSSIPGATSFNNQFKTLVTSTGSNSMTGTASGSGSPHNNVQPTIICNKIMRIL
jgi:microcystin-dependent protein